MNNKFNLNKICICLVVLLLLVLFLNVYLLNSIQKGTNVPEKKVPPLPKIELYALVPDNCPECLDIEAILPELAKSTKANVTKTEVIKQKDAGQLIKEYEIKHLPTILVKGEIENTQLSSVFAKSKDALVAKELPPPYYDVESNSVKGKVTLTLIEPNCKDCANLSFLGRQLSSQAGVFLEDQKTINADSLEAKELIKKYSLKILPTVILSEEISEYVQILPALESIATKESDNNYALREIPPPYYEISSNKVIGFVDALFLESSACKNCLDGETLKDTLSKVLGLKLKNVRKIDSSSTEGRDLIRKYNIEEIPTAIFSEESKAYPSMKQWTDVGSIENDGKYVFRNVEILSNVIGGKTYLINGTETNLTVAEQ